MKKIITIAMILILALSIFSCGKKQDTASEQTQNNDAMETENEEYILESDPSVPGDASDVDESEFNTSEGDAEYDFNFSATKSFAMGSAIAKIDYSDLSDIGSKLENNLSTAATDSLGGSYPVFSEYEEDDEEDIDRLAYAIGMENDDVEARYLECGAYHSKELDGYAQYIVFCSESFKEVNDTDIEKTRKAIADSFGVEIPRERLKKAVEIVWSKSQESQDYYSLYSTVSVEGDDYAENIIVSVDGFVSEENEQGYYISVQRERAYI